MLKKGITSYEVIQEIESKWINGIQKKAEFLNILKKEDITKFLEKLINATYELRNCIDMCVDEVLWLTWWDEHRDSCSVCKCVIGSSEAYVLIPNEYGDKLAYKLHEKCLEFLKTKVNEYSKQGFKGEDILTMLMNTPIPPSIAYEVLRMTNLVSNKERLTIQLIPQKPREDPLLRKKWEELKERVVREVKDLFTNISPGAQIVSYKKLKGVMPMPETVSKFYQALEMILESNKQSIIELLRECKEDEAKNKLKEIVMKIFSNPLIVTFPPLALVGMNKVRLDPTTISGLTDLCEMAGINISFKLEWEKNELLQLLDKIYDKESNIGKEWISTLKSIVTKS
jgi:hypothetical protein